MLKNLAKGVAALMLSSLLMLCYLVPLGAGIALCWHGFYFVGMLVILAVIGVSYYAIGRSGPDSLGI